MRRGSSFQAFWDELASGTQYGVFIDDTGSPGLELASTRLHPQRKSWVGVIIPPKHMPEVLEQFPEALEELTSWTGAEEFHFAEIYAGRGKFKDVPFEVRQAVFQFMAHILSEYQFPIFVQTLDPVSLAEVRTRGSFPERIGRFNLTKPGDFALFLLLIRIAAHIEKSRVRSDTKARVFVDEGLAKNGSVIRIPAWERVFTDGMICFGESSLILPIQLADFAAFAMNRTQLLLDKDQLTPRDRTFLEIVSPISSNFQNIEKRSISFGDSGIEWEADPQ